MTAQQPAGTESHGLPAWRSWAAGALFLAGLAWIVFSVIPARVVVPVFRHDPNYSHGLLFPIVAVLVLWRVRARLVASDAGPRWPGVALLVAGGALALIGHWVHTAFELGWRGYVFLQGAGWLIATAGWVCAVLGWKRFQILAPRLGFMVFVIPLPDTWLLTIMLGLQRWVAIVSAHALRFMGLVVFREGNVLHFPSVILGVAGACSGIRSLMAFFATAAVCAVFLDLGTKRAFLLLALAPVAAVGANILRVVATSLLTIRWGSIWLEGALHDAMGLVVVLLGGVFLFGAAQRLRPIRTDAVTSQGTFSFQAWACPWPTSVTTASLLVLVALGMGHVSAHYAAMARQAATPVVNRRPLSDFPRQVGDGRMASEYPLTAFEMDMLKPSDHVIRSYVDADGDETRLVVMYWDPRPYNPTARVRSPGPHSPNLCWRYEGWDLVHAEKTSSFEWMPDMLIHSSLFEKPGRKRFVLFWRSNDQGTSPVLSFQDFRSRVSALVRSWREMPAGWGAPVYQVRIDLPVENGADAAKARALAFARDIAGFLPEFGVGQRSGAQLTQSRPSELHSYAQ